MIRYALTRLALLVLGLVVASVLIFLTLRVLPGDVAQQIAGTNASPAQVDAIRERLGLNEPLTTQYVQWATGVLRGDLGASRDTINWVLTSYIVAAAIMTRYIRSAVLEVAAMGYVRTARSKGLPPRTVTLRHTVRNALVPILTITGIQLGTILGGVIVVEVVFAWPGIGRLVYTSVAARDYPVIQGAVLLIAVLFLAINLLVDLLYAIVDPRIRLS